MVHIYLYVYIYIYTPITYIHIYIYTYTCICICICKCTYIYPLDNLHICNHTHALYIYMGLYKHGIPQQFDGLKHHFPNFPIMASHQYFHTQHFNRHIPESIFFENPNASYLHIIYIIPCRYVIYHGSK